MTCQILVSERDLKKLLPKNLVNLPISNLSEGIDTSTVFVQGHITKKWELQRVKKTSLLKLEVVDESNKAVIFYLTGKYAETCQAVSIGDIIAVTNIAIKIKEVPGQVENEHEIYVDRARSEAKVWVVSTGQPVSTSVIETEQKTRARSYAYTPLKNVKIGSTVNVYGVVKFFKPASKSRGTDYSMMVSLTDQSLEPGEKVKCVLFAKEMEILPQVENVGDIVRIHRLKVGRFRGEIQGQKGAGFSCLVFDGDPEGSLTPRTKSTTFTFTEEDRERVEELREWTGTDALFSQPAGDDFHSGAPLVLPGKKTLSQVDIGQFFNLQCQVVSTCVIKQGESVLLTVWDGTKVKHPFYSEDTTKGDYHTRLKVSPQLLTKSEGFTVDIFAFDDHFEKANEIKPEDFIYLHNLHAARHKFSSTEDNIVPTIEFCLHQGTSYGRRLTKLSPETEDARLLQLLLNEAAGDESIEMPDDHTDIQPGPAPVTTIVSDAQPGPAPVTTDIPEAQPGPAPVSPVLSEAQPGPAPVSPVLSEAQPGPAPVSPVLSEAQPGPASVSHIAPGRMSVEEPVADRPQEQTTEPSVAMETDVMEFTTSSDLARCLEETATVITEHHQVKTSPLSEVLAHEVPYKFRVKAQVYEMEPNSDSVERFLRLLCPHCNFLAQVPGTESLDKSEGQREYLWSKTAQPHQVIEGVKYYSCPDCSTTGDSSLEESGADHLSYIYMLQFVLGDGTGWIVAGLWKNEAEKFFHGVTPTEMLKDPTKYSDVREDLLRICPSRAIDDGRPRVECCVCSYTTPSGVCYKIFDTMLSVSEQS